MAPQLAPFDPEWLAVEEMMGGRQTLPAEPVERSRARFDAIFQMILPLLPPPDDSVEAKDIIVPSSQQSIRVFKPANATGPLPVGLFIHSGGWYAGSIENEDFLCRDVAKNSQIILFSADYRLAPEHPYPAGFDDLCAAYNFMHENASMFGGDAAKKFIMGGSAGGNLTAAVALKYATNADLKPSGLCILVPAICEPSALPAEYKAKYTPEMYVDAPIIGNELVTQARGEYDPSSTWSLRETQSYSVPEWYGAPAADPLSSVLLHPDIKHLPQCYMAVCTKDPLHQEGLFFHEECKKHGVAADLVEWVGFPHYFWTVPQLKKSKVFMDFWNEKLRAMIAGTLSVGYKKL